MDVQRFPVTSWMIAGAALCCLGINEIMFVRPMRQKLERSEMEEAAVAAGAKPRVLDSGAVLMQRSLGRPGAPHAVAAAEAAGDHIGRRCHI